MNWRKWKNLIKKVRVCVQCKAPAPHVLWDTPFCNFHGRKIMVHVLEEYD